MTRHRIVVTQPVHDDVAQRLATLGELDLHPGPEPLPPAELARRLQGASAMLGFMTDRVDADLLRAARGLRIVAAALKGFDGYDVEACTRAGIWFTIVPDLLTEPTAELAVGLAIGLGRHLREGDALVRGGGFGGWRAQLYGSGLHGTTVAVLGMGRVGRAVVDRLRGFGCRLLGVDSHAPMPTGVDGVSLDEALAQAALVIVALPLTAGTHQLIDDARLVQSREGALWINVGRGSVVDEAAMLRALRSGRAGGYAADVFAFEDAGLADRPSAIDVDLRTHPRTLFTPHLGSAVREVRRAIEHRAVDNIEAAMKGRRPPDAINDIA